MQIDGKEYIQLIEIDQNLSLYQVYFCSDFVSAAILWKETERNSKQIGYLTGLNHPSEDGTNPHWKVILEINKIENRRIKSISFDRFIEALKGVTPIEEPMWVEMREFESRSNKVVGDLWNDD